MTILIYKSYIAGLSFSKPDFSLLIPHDAVKITHEAGNEFDARAIRIDHPTAGKLGYIARESTDVIHEAFALFAGKKILSASANIVPFPDGRNGKILLSVHIHLPDAPV